MAWINITGYHPNWGCFHAADAHSGLWGYRLCSNVGELYPDHFSCYRDIFTAMDVDKNGVVSREEYTGFSTVAMVKKNAEAKKKLEQEEEAEEKGGEETADPEEPEEEVVHDFVLLAAVIFV